MAGAARPVWAMRIGLVAEYVDRHRGGAETSVGEYAAHLAAAGIDVVCLTSGGRASREGGVEVRPIGGGAGPRWWRYRCFLEKARQAAQTGEFDLVHAIVPCAGADIYQPRGGTIPETLARNLALAKPGIRRMLKRWQQGLTLKQRVMLAAERELLAVKPGPIVACLSSYVARQVEEHYGLRGPRVRVVLNGVNPDASDARTRESDRARLRQEWGFDQDTVVFATVAHNFKLKGVHRFLEAGGMVGRNGHRVGFVVAGGGGRQRYERIARRCGIAGAVRFVGAIPDVWGLYHAADACVLASYYDPCSRVVLEALSAGLPCVTTRYNGAADVMEEGDTGYVVESPDDVSALADRMALLLDGPRRQRMGEAGKALRDEVSMARHAREMLVLYEEVVSGRSSRA
jgi:UDP-glucose:(heptosyl)LPS alpha-1,3-glucosyltransferase